MGMNTHRITAGKSETFALASGASTAAMVVPASRIGLIVDETTAGIIIDIEISNDGTLWFQHPDGIGIATDDVIVLDCPFAYIRATDTAGAGGAATISFSW